MRSPDVDLTFWCSLTRAVHVWVSKLGSDEDANFFINGVAFGFRSIPNMNAVVSTDSENYRSTLSSKNKILLDQLFMEVLQLGRITRQIHKPLKI